LTFGHGYVQLNRIRSRQLHDALENLTKAIHEVEAAVETMRGEHDPLASHIFISRRHYRNIADTKGGKRREINARLSFNTACELGFRGSLDEWERLMGAVARRWQLRGTSGYSVGAGFSAVLFVWRFRRERLDDFFEARIAAERVPDREQF
jgi:hypothetical protein